MNTTIFRRNRIHALYFFIAFHALSGVSFAGPACEALENHALSEGVISPPEIKPWTFDNRDFAVTKEQVLPREFLDQIESAVGELRLKLGIKKDSISIEIESRSYDIVARVELSRDPSFPDALVVEELRLENPLDKAPVDQLKASQYKKGIPISAFKYARNQVLKIASSGGLKRIRTGGAQNYSVFMLYRKIVGMVPETDVAIKYTELVDRYYQFARKSLPESLQAKSVQEFTDMLGDFNAPRTDGPMNAQWNRFLKTGTAASDMQLIKDPSGEIIAVVFAAKSNPRVVFVDIISPDKKLFEWADVASAHLMSLTSP